MCAMLFADVTEGIAPQVRSHGGRARAAAQRHAERRRLQPSIAFTSLTSSPTAAWPSPYSMRVLSA
jgi:hypothetical protein